jgi:spore coat polysaccharide biosynthesis protein SpsF
VKTVVIIQARMTSTRLPGKVLADLCGRPMLEQQLRRVREMQTADEIVIATTVQPTDDLVEALARRQGLRCFRGDEHDVLSRYVGAARESGADVVVRITADCPLIDAGESDRVTRALLEDPQGADYATNSLSRTYPRGLDTEVLHRDVLERVARLARSRPAREHVTWFIHRERPELFVQRSVADTEDNSDLRWTVDTPEDLALARRIYADLDLGATTRPYREVLAHVRDHPEISALNAAIAQKDS